MDPKKYFIVTFALFSNGEVYMGILILNLMNNFFLDDFCISPPRLQTRLVL